MTPFDDFVYLINSILLGEEPTLRGLGTKMPSWTNCKDKGANDSPSPKPRNPSPKPPFTHSLCHLGWHVAVLPLVERVGVRCGPVETSVEFLPASFGRLEDEPETECRIVTVVTKNMTIEDFILLIGTFVAFIAFILWCCFPIVPKESNPPTQYDTQYTKYKKTDSPYDEKM